MSRRSPAGRIPGAAPSGGSIQDSRWAGYYDGDSMSPAPQDTWTDVDTWAEDSSAGDDITLDVDAKTFTLDGAGGKVYAVNGGAVTSLVNATELVLSTLTGVGMASSDGMAAVSTPAAQIVATGNQPNAGCWIIDVPSDTATFKMRVMPTGGSDDETLANALISIYRLR